MGFDVYFSNRHHRKSFNQMLDMQTDQSAEPADLGAVIQRRRNIRRSSLDSGALFRFYCRGAPAFQQSTSSLPKLWRKQRLSKLAAAASSLLANARRHLLLLSTRSYRNLEEHLPTRGASSVPPRGRLDAPHPASQRTAKSFPVNEEEEEASEASRGGTLKAVRSQGPKTIFWVSLFFPLKEGFIVWPVFHHKPTCFNLVFSFVIIPVSGQVFSVKNGRRQSILQKSCKQTKETKKTNKHLHPTTTAQFHCSSNKVFSC